ncbi:MAG: hypothetical protein A2X22_05965 [Bacteroidetes bacterium GWF2_49_14]|nr:MAG: hypothetical protein A2X22_05965 [Bacteroidetes bacterium GWF2_49_14]HBB90581.1 hypothetical protein [Bacteroidales bacterium]
MKTDRLNLFLAGFLILATVSCKPVVDYPDIPEISFTGVVVKDSSDVLDNDVKRVTLTFHMVDGNGDIGLATTDTSGPFNKDSLYYYNLFIQEYKGENGIFTEVPEPGGLKRFRIPDISPTGQNKTLIADISVTLEYPWSEFNPLPFNEFRYQLHLVDRALNHSNTDTTTVIVW